MKIVAVVAGLLLSVTTLATPASATASAEPSRILIVGDSVTQGSKGDYTWRYFLWNALQARGDSVDFVGRRTGTFYFHPTGELDWDYNEADAYADPNFDQDHGAWFGGRIEVDGNYFYDPIGPQVAAHNPDVIVSMWGINDLSRDDRGPADVIASYRAWFTAARAVDPDVDFVVGRLPYVWLYDGEVVEFNALLGELASELTTEASRISVATMTESYTEANDSGDYVHPNTSGQRKIAGMIGETLVPLIEKPAPTEPAFVVPAAPAPVPPAVVPPQVAPPPTQTAASPAAPRRVRAVRGEGRTVVTWRKTADAMRYTARCGSRSASAVGTRAVIRSQSARCSVRAIGINGRSEWVVVRVRKN